MNKPADVKAEDLSPERFPTFTKLLEGRDASKFGKGLTIFASGLRMDGIPNVTYTEAKQQINDAIYEAHVKLVAPFYANGAGKDNPFDLDDLVYYNRPQLHTIAGRIKKLDASKLEHPSIAIFRALLVEALPLALANEALKTKIIKRVPKPPEERKETFVPRMASNDTVKGVFALLTSITQSKRDELVAAGIAWGTRVVDNYLTAQIDAEKPVDPHTYFSKRQDSEGLYMAQRCIKYERRHGSKPIIERLPDADEQIQKFAVGNADLIRDKFVYKNLRKIAAIVDTKGNLQESTVISCSVTERGMLGTLRFAFSDGSAFQAQKSVVLSHSIHGKPFLRFPLTFHDVQMPDGKPMKQPSEERMNTVFAGRYYGTIAAPKSEQTILESLGIRLGAYDAVQGVFPAEVSYEAKAKLEEFSSDFKADLLLRSFEEVDEMPQEGLAAELAWHRWAESLDDKAIYRRLHVPLDEVRAKIAENAQKTSLQEAFGPQSTKPTNSPGLN